MAQSGNYNGHANFFRQGGGPRNVHRNHQRGIYQSTYQRKQKKIENQKKASELYFTLCLLPAAEEWPRDDGGNNIQSNVRFTCEKMLEIFNSLEALEKNINHEIFLVLAISKLPKLLSQQLMNEFNSELLLNESHMETLKDTLNQYRQPSLRIKDEFIGSEILSSPSFRGSTRKIETFHDISLNGIHGGKQSWLRVIRSVGTPTQTKKPKMKEQSVGPKWYVEKPKEVKHKATHTASVIMDVCCQTDIEPQLSFKNNDQANLTDNKVTSLAANQLHSMIQSVQSCAFCNGDHFNSKCSLNKTRKQRKESLIKQKKCFRCFKSDHLIDSCPKEPRICFNCEELGHHRLLCKQPDKRHERRPRKAAIHNNWPGDKHNETLSKQHHELMQKNLLKNTIEEYLRLVISELYLQEKLKQEKDPD